MSTGVSKIAAQRNHRVLLELSSKPGNDICADCKARAPRWASYNLGIFLCVSCASIHRKIGTHITKVKSITLDEWSKEQVEVMKEMGNIKSNALYNPNEARHPPPTNMIDTERDSELEKFIRSKYEFKRFVDRKSGSASQHISAGPRGASLRSSSVPIMDFATFERETSPGPPPPPKTPENMPPSLRYSATIPPLPNNVPPPTRSISQPLPLLVNSDRLSVALPVGQQTTAQPPVQKPAGKVWDDLISLQEPSQASSLPLQYSPAIPTMGFPSQLQVPTPHPPTMPGNTPNPFLNLSLAQGHMAAPLVASPASLSIPCPQFPLAPSVPLSSPALHLGTTNPFNQAFSSVNGTVFPTSSNPFSSAVSVSTPTTPSAQPVMPLPTGAGAMLSTPGMVGYFPPQASTSASVPVLPSTFPLKSFVPAPFPSTPGMIQQQRSFTPPVIAPGQVQVPLSAGLSPSNPFSAMQMGMGQAGFPSTAPAAATMVLGQQHPHSQQQQLGFGSQSAFGAWHGQGVPGTF